MNDLSMLLDATQATTCEFLGKTINLEVYTAGISRLTHEEGEELRDVTARYRESHVKAVALQKQIQPLEAAELLCPLGDEQAVQLETLRGELSDLDTGSVEIMRVIVPFMLKSWSLNGEPMKRNGEDFPPTKENLVTVPDNLLLAVGNAAEEVWRNPTIAGSESGSAQTESLEKNQTETITNSTVSD
jgi:hypothetical protein